MTTAESRLGNPEPLLDLQRLTAGIRWRRRTCTVLALVGLLVGAVVGGFLPGRATATARIYVVHVNEGSGDGQSVMKTDLALLDSTTVAGAAVQRLGIDMTPEKFTGQYSGVVVADNILEVEARGDNDGQAVSRAQALADSFLAVHVAQSSDAAKAQVKAILDLQAQVQSELSDVNDQITTAAAAAPDAAKMDGLVGRRSALSSQISDLSQQASTAGIGSPQVAAGTKIIDSARATSRSVLVSTGLYAVIGLILGFGLGLAFAAVATVARDRPVLRRDIAAHLGGSVVAQVPAPLRGPRRLLGRSRAEAERQRVAATLARLVRADSAPVSVLELGCPGLAAGLVRDIADELALERPVLLIDDLPGQELTALGAAGEDTPTGAADGVEEEPADGRPPRAAVDLVPGSSYPSDPPRDRRPRELRLAVGTVGPGAPWTDLHRLGSEALVVLRAGSTEAAWLHTVARQLADSGIAIIGVVVVHPDPRDRSDGTLWDALHTAVRGRLSAAPHLVVTAAAVPQTPPAVPQSLPAAPPVPSGVDVPTVHLRIAVGEKSSADAGGPVPPTPAVENRPPQPVRAANGAGVVNGPAPAAAGAPRPNPQNGRRPSPKPHKRPPASEPGARPRPRPRLAADVDGHPTDKFHPVVHNTPAEHVEAT